MVARCFLLSIIRSPLSLPSFFFWPMRCFLFTLNFCILYEKKSLSKWTTKKYRQVVLFSSYRLELHWIIRIFLRSGTMLKSAGPSFLLFELPTCLHAGHNPFSSVFMRCQQNLQTYTGNQIAMPRIIANPVRNYNLSQASGKTRSRSESWSKSWWIEFLHTCNNSSAIAYDAIVPTVVHENQHQICRCYSAWDNPCLSRSAQHLYEHFKAEAQQQLNRGNVKSVGTKNCQRNCPDCLAHERKYQRTNPVLSSKKCRERPWFYETAQRISLFEV